MNADTEKWLKWAKDGNGSLISKQDFINAVKDVFSPTDPLPKSEPTPDEFDNPYLSYEIGQDHHTRWDANPFKVFLEWYGLDESTGYVILGNHLFGNGGKIDDLRDIFRKAYTDQDYRIVKRDPRTGLEN